MRILDDVSELHRSALGQMRLGSIVLRVTNPKRGHLRKQ